VPGAWWPSLAQEIPLHTVLLARVAIVMNPPHAR
jgi:hypothetical protein